MAKGLSASVARLAAIIEGCDSSAGWKRSKQRISTLDSEEILPVYVEHRYWIKGESRGRRPVVSGELTTTTNRVMVELSRHWGKGDIHNKDFYNLHRALEAEADIVEQSILFPNNWDKDNTGMILVNLEPGGEIRESDELPVLLWVAEFAVMIRQPETNVTVS